MLYGVTVATTVSYDVQVEAESFNHAAEKAVDYVKNIQDIHGKICDAARSIVPDGVLADERATVELIYAPREAAACV